MTNRYGMALLILTAVFVGGPMTGAMAHVGQNHACHDLDNQPVGYDNISACCYNPQQDGPSNTNGYPYCPAVLDQIPGGEQYSPIDRSTLAHTHICKPGVDCGPAAQLSNVRPFYGTAGAPTPPAIVPASAPVVLAPPPPVFVTPAPVVAVAPPPVFIPATPVLAAPAAVASAGLGNAGLIAAGLGAAALIGIAAVALGDDDSGNATSGSR